MNIYKEATKNKQVRFNLGNGEITVVDLWHYSLEKLDTAYSILCTELENIERTSLLKPKTDIAKLLELKLAIIKDVVETKIAEKQAKELRTLQLDRARIIREKLALRKEQALDSLTEEELLKELEQIEREV